MSHLPISLLKTKRFLPLFIVQFWGAFNDNAFKASLGMLITYKLVADPSHAQLLINLAGGLFILPFFLFSTIAGELADKLPRKNLIIAIKTLEIAFMILALLGFYFSQISMLMLTLFLMGIHSTFFGPIKYSALPDLLKQNELLAGNSLVEASTFIAILIGTILGTELGDSRAGALMVAGISIAAACVGWFSSFFLPHLPIGDPRLKINLNIFSAIKKLLRFTASNRPVFFSIIGISWFWFMGFVFLTQFPVFVRHIIGGNSQVVTLFLVVFTVGIALGSLLCNWVLRGEMKTKYVPWGILAMSFFIFDLCWACHGEGTVLFQEAGALALLSLPVGWRIVCDLLLIAVAGGFFILPLYALMQIKSEMSHRSRTIAANNIVNSLFMFIAALVAMALTAIGFNSVDLFLSMGIVNALVGFSACRILQKAKGLAAK